MATATSLLISCTQRNFEEVCCLHHLLKDTIQFASICSHSASSLNQLCICLGSFNFFHQVNQLVVREVDQEVRQQVFFLLFDMFRVQRSEAVYLEEQLGGLCLVQSTNQIVKLSESSALLVMINRVCFSNAGLAFHELWKQNSIRNAAMHGKRFSQVAVSSLKHLNIFLCAFANQNRRCLGEVVPKLPNVRAQANKELRKLTFSS
mmetsp:Transcript_11643/g.16838  ORF Transcript_11643/g.16838 Transcript_11643/m.16838 type:complete len:205 (+) Transcript_11643:218-832(+)